MLTLLIHRRRRTLLSVATNQLVRTREQTAVPGRDRQRAAPGCGWWRGESAGHEADGCAACRRRCPPNIDRCGNRGSPSVRDATQLPGALAVAGSSACQPPSGQYNGKTEAHLLFHTRTSYYRITRKLPKQVRARSAFLQ